MHAFFIIYRVYPDGWNHRDLVKAHHSEILTLYLFPPDVLNSSHALLLRLVKKDPYGRLLWKVKSPWIPEKDSELDMELAS